MSLPNSVMTAAEAAAYVDQASLAASLPRGAWDNANDATRQAAVDTAWRTIAGEPGTDLANRTGDQALRLAVVVEALVRLDLQADTGAAARSRLAAQGVGTVSLGGIGGVSEQYGRRPALHPVTRNLLTPYRGAVGIR